VFKDAAKIDVVHVPYKGIPEAMNDTMTNRVQFFMRRCEFRAAGARRQAHRARVTAPKRVSMYRTFRRWRNPAARFVFDSWAAARAAKTPRTIIDRLNAK